VNNTKNFLEVRTNLARNDIDLANNNFSPKNFKIKKTIFTDIYNSYRTKI